MEGQAVDYQVVDDIWGADYLVVDDHEVISTPNDRSTSTTSSRPHGAAPSPPTCDREQQMVVQELVLLLKVLKHDGNDLDGLLLHAGDALLQRLPAAPVGLAGLLLPVACLLLLAHHLDLLHEFVPACKQVCHG